MADGLRRFVLTADLEPVLDSADFLELPDQWWNAKDRRPIPVPELLRDSSGYVLLAPGGAGKTVTFKALAKTDTGARYVNTSLTALPQFRDEFKAAVETNTALYLDSLDEALDGAVTVFRWLEEAAEVVEPTRLRLRLACRSIVWRASLSRKLRIALPGFRELKLLPMDRATAFEAVSEAGVDGRAFLTAIVGAGLGRLSATPRQLLATADYWRDEGRLPDSAVEAMVFEVGRLVEESDEQRPADLPIERGLRLARRMAAFASFGETALFTAAPSGAKAVYSVDNLPVDPEPAEPGRSVEPADYRHVLATALFDAAPDGTLAFRHRQYTEFLTAAYLVERGIAREQVPALLGVHANGLVPAERAGVAAWLAALSPDLAEDLFHANAVMFVSATAELPSDRARAAVVDGLLASAPDQSEIRRMRLDLAALAHPGLPAQLEARFSAGICTSRELWWLARLAVAGKCTDLAGRFTQAALDPSWDADARCAAVKATGRVGTEADRLALRELLQRGQDEDFGNEVFGTVLDVLYPGHLSTSDLTELLRLPDRLSGRYYQTLDALATRVPAADLASFTWWFTGRAAGEGEHLIPLTMGLIKRTWTESSDPAVRSALVALIVSQVNAGRWDKLHYERAGRSPWMEGPPERRRELTVAVAVAGGWQAVEAADLLIAEDTEWLLDVLPSLLSEPDQQLVGCLVPFLSEPTASVADRVLSMSPTHPVFAATATFRGTVELDSREAREGKELAAVERARLESQVVRARVQAVLAAAENASAAFPDVVYSLTLLDMYGGTTISLPEITMLPGWLLLSPQQQQDVLALGKRFVKEVEPVLPQSADVDEWAEWAGVAFLVTLQRHAPQQMAGLGLTVWERWLHALMAVSHRPDEEDLDSRRALLDAVPAQLRETLLTTALNHLDHTARYIAAPAAYEYLAKEIAPALADRIVADRYSPDVTAEVLSLLVEHGPSSIALETCRQVATSPNRIRALAATQSLGRLDPNGVVDDLSSGSEEPEELEFRVDGLAVAKLSLSHLERLATVLLDAFPYSAGPSQKPGGFVLSQGCVEVREAVLRRLADHGQVSTLEKLASGRGDHDRRVISKYQRSAKVCQADLAITTTRPRAVLDLLRSTDARLVRDDADLCEVIIHQLNRLQHRITHDGAFRDLWNGTESPKSEDDISDWIRRQLAQSLRGSVLVDREVQVMRKKDKGVGTRIDLTASAATPTSAEIARVIFEAKLVSNAELMTAIRTQLIDRYLLPTGNTRGIYLVYWIEPGQRPKTWSANTARTREGLLADLRKHAATPQDGIEVHPYVLDISRSS